MVYPSIMILRPSSGMSSTINPMSDFKAVYRIVQKARIALMGGFSVLLLSATLSAQITVSFDEAGQTHIESANSTVVVELSPDSLTGQLNFTTEVFDGAVVFLELNEASFVEFDVPYTITSATTATLDDDYRVYEPTTESGDEVVNQFKDTIKFRPGDLRKPIPIEIINDNNEEGDELIVLAIDTSNLSVAGPGEILTHTIRVRDNDIITARFASHNEEFSESQDIAATIILSSPSDSEITIPFTVATGTAQDADIDPSASESTTSPITIPAGSTTARIIVSVVNDNITDADTGGSLLETVTITMGTPSLEDNGGNLLGDPIPFTGTIRDNEPITIQFSDFVNEGFEIAREEFASGALVVELIDPEGNPTSAGTEIEVPFTLSGTATEGDSDTSDYDVIDSPISIAEGQSAVNFNININNDDTAEEDETIIIDLAQPNYVDEGGDLVLGENRFQITIEDNDPVTLQFGAVFSRDDEEAAEDFDVDDIRFIPADGIIVGESQGFVNIPVFLSSPVANAVSFDLEIVSAGTSATFIDPRNLNADTDENSWDFTSGAGLNITSLDSTLNVSIPAGVENVTIPLILNNNDETPVVFGQSPAEDVEPDESIQLRISNVNTGDSQVNLGSQTTYDITVKELPDIDVTALFNGLSPNPSNFIAGGPRYNSLTSLHEVIYNLSLNTPLNPNDFAGYRSFKFSFRTATYDLGTPDSAGNDPLVSDPQFPAEDQAYQLFVDPQFEPHYPDGFDFVLLREGEDQTSSDFTDVNADLSIRNPFVLRPLNLPTLNDSEAVLDNRYGINESFDWTVEFSNAGFLQLDTSKIDPAQNADRLKVFLSVDDVNLTGLSGNLLAVPIIEPQTDGSVLIVPRTNTVRFFEIQYQDENGEWKVAQPAVIENPFLINNRVSNFHFWLDLGPPKTEKHPSEAPFRMYRVITR